MTGGPNRPSFRLTPAPPGDTLPRCAAESFRSSLSPPGCSPGHRHVPPTIVVIRGGTIYDGSGGAPYAGDVAISGDRIVAVGPASRGRGAREIDAARPRRRAGLHQHAELGDREPDRGRPQPERHPPGRHAGGDGRGLVDGPAQPGDEAAGALAAERHPLPDRLDHARRISRASRAARHRAQRRQLRRRRRPCASTSSAKAMSIPTPEQLARMRALVRQAMDEGAMGVGSSLIYAPGNFAETDELVALVGEARPLRRHVYQPYAIGGRPHPRVDRRADRDRPPLRRAAPKSTI